MASSIGHWRDMVRRSQQKKVLSVSPFEGCCHRELQRTLVETASLAGLADGCFTFGIHAFDIFIYAAAIASVVFLPNFLVFFS
jgi:hypothetical protein